MGLFGAYEDAEFPPSAEAIGPLKDTTPDQRAEIQWARPKELLVSLDWALASRAPAHVVYSRPSALDASERIIVRQ